MRLAPIATAAAILAAFSTPAGATGGLGCEARDTNLSFAVDTAVARGMGGPFFEFHATLDLMMDGVPDDLRKLTLDEALTHSWLDGKELKLQFYVERQDGDYASIDFVVETTMVEEGEYRGGYLLTVVTPETPMPPIPSSVRRPVTSSAMLNDPDAGGIAGRGRQATQAAAMKTADRKAAIAAYKERKAAPGIFAVRCLPTGEIWVGHAPDLATIKNRVWFALDHGSHRAQDLQAAWNTHGADGFGFEELERVDPDQPA